MVAIKPLCFCLVPGRNHSLSPERFALNNFFTTSKERCATLTSRASSRPLLIKSYLTLRHPRTTSLDVILIWSKAVISQVLFSRRKNYDSTEESICMHCLLTVARSHAETLEEAERNHDCEEAIIVECRRWENTQRGTF
jgi:hypothetical protein